MILNSRTSVYEHSRKHENSEKIFGNEQAQRQDDHTEVCREVGVEGFLRDDGNGSGNGSGNGRSNQHLISQPIVLGFSCLVMWAH